MSARRPFLRFFLDAGVPDSVGLSLTRLGHVVILHREALPERTPDDVVCRTAIANEAILVAIDHDMRRLVRGYGAKMADTLRFENLNLIAIGCSEVLAAKRITQALALIEHEWAFTSAKRSRRLWIEIGPHHIRTNR